MRVTEIVDYNHVQDRHQAIHARAGELAQVGDRSPAWLAGCPDVPYVPEQVQAVARPVIQTPVDTLDAVLVEKAVYALPEKHREAVRWWYVYRRNPAAMARSLGVSKQGLADLVVAGRTMLQNKL